MPVRFLLGLKADRMRQATKRRRVRVGGRSWDFFAPLAVPGQWMRCGDNSLDPRHRNAFIAAMYERLRCGVIFTEAFRDWLTGWRNREAAGNFGLVPELAYVRIAGGSRAGQSWVSLIWRPLQGVKEHEIFQIGAVKVYLNSQTRHSLKDRCLDVKDGAVVVV